MQRMPPIDPIVNVAKRLVNSDYIYGLTESAMRRIIGRYASLALAPDRQRPLTETLREAFCR
jgi:hypothetical protein